jgi:hypothetical protein
VAGGGQEDHPASVGGPLTYPVVVFRRGAREFAAEVVLDVQDEFRGGRPDA